MPDHDIVMMGLGLKPITSQPVAKALGNSGELDLKLELSFKQHKTITRNVLNSIPQINTCKQSSLNIIVNLHITNNKQY